MKVLLDFVGKPESCVPVHVIECPCMFATRFTQYRQRFLNIMRVWNKKLQEIANREEFQNREVN